MGLDTEFVRERTYWPHLALVQAAFDDGVVLLIDPLAPGMADALAQLLRNEAIVKIMHSASEDLVALQHACGALPRPLFDTQIAAALAGAGGGLGYQKLVQQLLGVDLAKGETRSDWMRRPLSPAQLDYASDDVRHLHAIHSHLQQRLAELGRLDWLREDCERLLANAERDEREPWPHLGMRAAQYLDRASQVRLLRLLRWRDAQARSSDLPRTWVLDNEFAVRLAQQPPTDVAALQSAMEKLPRAPRRLGDALWQALTTPLPDEAAAPLSQSDDHDRQRLRKLQHAVAHLSEQLQLPESVLASRRWLQSLLEGQDWPGALSGWRRAVLEPHFAPILRSAGGAPGSAV